MGLAYVATTEEGCHSHDQYLRLRCIGAYLRKDQLRLVTEG